QRQVKLRRGPAAEGDDGNAGSEGNGGEQKLFRARRQLAQFDCAHEATDQHAEPEKRDVAARLQLTQPRHGGLPEKVNDGTPNGDFPADIHEDREHPEIDVRKFQGGESAFDFSFAHVRQVDEEKNYGENEENEKESEVRHFHRSRAVSAGPDKVLKDEIAADERTERRAERVESLGKIEPARCGPFGPENRDVWIGGDL